MNSVAPPIRCACTCARWARWNCSPAKAKSKSPSASRTASDRYLSALATYPESIGELLREYAKVERAEIRLSDVISGFIDAEPAENEAPPPIVVSESATTAKADGDSDDDSDDDEDEQ